MQKSIGSFAVGEVNRQVGKLVENLCGFKLLFEVSGQVDEVQRRAADESLSANLL